MAQTVAEVLDRARPFGGESCPVSRLDDLDGLSVKNCRNMPHAAVLASWSDRGLYAIDCELGTFRLTEAGRLAATLARPEG